jgi:hypothetical protein
MSQDGIKMIQELTEDDGRTVKKTIRRDQKVIWQNCAKSN